MPFIVLSILLPLLVVIPASLEEIPEAIFGKCEFESDCHDDGLQLMQTRATSIQKAGAKLAKAQQKTRQSDSASTKNQKVQHVKQVNHSLGVVGKLTPANKSIDDGHSKKDKVAISPTRASAMGAAEKTNPVPSSALQLRQNKSHKSKRKTRQPWDGDDDDDDDDDDTYTQNTGYTGYADDTYTETSHQGFFSRLAGSMSSVVIGIILIVFSIPVLWFNEKRAAAYEALLKRGEADVHMVGSEKAIEDNRNTLVLVPGARMCAVKPVEDSRFNVKYQSRVIQLETTISVYQWVEKEKQEEKEKLGGGKETITTYYYEKEWRDEFNDGRHFKLHGHTNHKPEGVNTGAERVRSGRVEFGGGFLIEGELIDMACAKDEAAKINNEIKLKKNAALSFKPGEAGCYYTGIVSNPQIGDVKVDFRTVTDKPASVLALQVEKKDEPHGGRDTFLPYRNIRRPCCPCYDLDEEEEKQALFEASKKSVSELAAEQSCTGCLAVLCCCCNLVNMFCASYLTPELYHLILDPVETKEDAFRLVKARASAITWLIRFGGWLMMWIGFALLFSPVLMFIRVFPILGPIISDLGGFAVWMASFIVTLLVSVFIIALAYTVYHPMMGAMCFGVLGVIVIAIIVFSIAGQNHGVLHSVRGGHK